MNSLCETSDLLVFAHLRWEDVYERPQHLLSRHAKYRRVYYFEEPVYGKTEIPRYHLKETDDQVSVVTPYLPAHTSSEEAELLLRDLVDELVYEEELTHITAWYYDPRAYKYSSHLETEKIIYDCISEFSSECEEPLLSKADLVLTDGTTLFESKKSLHTNIHALLDSCWDSAFKLAANLEKSLPKKKIPFHSPFHFIKPIVLNPHLSH